MNRYTFRWHEDPQHAWLEVPRPVVESTGYRPTRYSYESGDVLYLEEDVDAPRFLDLIKARGDQVATDSVYCGNSHWIRNLRHCPA